MPLRPAVAGIVLCTAPAAVIAGDTLPSASSQDHAWFIVERATPTHEVELLHHARTMDGPFYDKGLPLPRMPEAMAAWRNRLWLIFGTPTRREIFTTQVRWNPSLGAWYHEPRDRLRAVTPLMGFGTLVDATATADGPVVLMMPDTPDRAVLLRLLDRQWVQVPLPGACAPGPGSHLFAGGDRGEQLVLVEPADRGNATVHWRDARGRWTRSEVAVSAGRIRTLTGVWPAIAMIAQGTDPGVTEVSYLRPSSRLHLTGFATPGGAWTVFGVRDGLRLVELVAGTRLTMRRIDPVSGAVGEPHPMSYQPLMTSRILHRPLLIAVTVTALMVVLLFKPPPNSATVSLRPTQVVLRPWSRVVAVGVDGAGAAVVTLLMLRCRPQDLMHLPLWTPDLAQSIPFLVMLGLTVVHSTVTELSTGRTLGKVLVGGRVVAADGSAPRARAILIRNMFKLLVLLIPVLAVVGLLNPHVQGLGDSMAGTVVVGEIPGSSQRPANDR